MSRLMYHQPNLTAAVTDTVRLHALRAAVEYRFMERFGTKATSGKVRLDFVPAQMWLVTRLIMHTRGVKSQGAVSYYRRWTPQERAELQDFVDEYDDLMDDRWLGLARSLFRR